MGSILEVGGNQLRIPRQMNPQRLAAFVFVEAFVGLRADGIEIGGVLGVWRIW